MVDSGSARIQALLMLIIVLLLGIIVGGAAVWFAGAHLQTPHATMAPGRPPRPGAPMSPRRGLHEGVHSVHEKMFGALHLTAEQRTEVHKILATRRHEMDALLESSREDLRAILTEDQAQRFDELRPPHPPEAPSAQPH